MSVLRGLLMTGKKFSSVQMESSKYGKPNEEYNKNCILSTVKHGGGSIMVWGSMSYNGVGVMTVINEIMTKEVYVRLLKENLDKSIKKVGLGRRYIFQQDQDPKYTSNLAKDYFEKKKINVLPWPPQSPVLNAIEHLWSNLKNLLKNGRPSSKKEMQKFLAEEWGNISTEAAL